MKLENATCTNLKDIAEMIQNRELLLPDFQRGFVWDAEKQKALIASVLAKMPLGSVLLLEAKVTDYGCRILGRKDEPDFTGRDAEEDIYVLLDGQQRLTVLANVFSNLLYFDYSESDNLDCDYKKLISIDLRNRFFLKIPAIENLEEKKDIFHLKDLEFAMKNPEKDIPAFLTGDIREYIEVISFDENTLECYAPHTEKPQNITDFCIKEEYYLIPLYLLIGNRNGDSSNETRLKNILKDIVKKVVRYRIETEFDILQTLDERKQFVTSWIEPDYREEIISEDGVDRERLEAMWMDMGETHWADKMKIYLISCINHMDLHQIVVAKSGRNRAIDIYENLNMGGITLSTFELILAKAAKKKLPENKNLYDLIVKCIQMPVTYETAILPEKMEKHFKQFLKRNEEYSATAYLKCFDEKRNRLNKKYTEAFLNVLSLLSYVPDYDAAQIDISMIKRERILNLTADLICKNYSAACRGIDRAGFFLQTRCGIRKIQEMNYNLMLVLLAYIFTNDFYYQKKDTSNVLEAWYWSAIFSGRYDKDQTEHIVEDIKNMLVCIQGKGNLDWLRELRNQVFDMKGFSDEDTLLMKTSVIPKIVMRKSICQFYLSKSYKDLLTDEILHPFSESADELEEHHIAPIGCLKGRTYKKMEADEQKRENRNSIFQSPLNFALITKTSNRSIASQNLDYYIKCCNEDGIFELKIEGEGNELSRDTLLKILTRRFDYTKLEVLHQIDAFL